MTFFGEEERRSEHSGEERSRKRHAVRDDESAFTSEQQRRGVTFFGEEEQDKRADVTRRSAGLSLAVFAPTSEERSRKRYAVRDDERRPRECTLGYNKNARRRTGIAWIEIITPCNFF